MPTIKKKKKYDKIVFLGKTKLNIIKILNSKVLIDSYDSHNKFVSVNNILRKHHEMKKSKMSWNFCWTQYTNIVDIRNETNERNHVETAVDNDGKLWLIMYIRRTRS